MKRVVPVEHLPESLWSSRTLHIAPALARAYQDRVAGQGLSALANSRDSKRPPTGGLSKEAADEHFAQAFDGSVARSQLALLDPHEDLVFVADALATICGGGKLVILDVPSGAGAFSLALLCTLAELRASDVVPRQPLQVTVVGGEISPRARQHAVGLFGTLVEVLESQAIWVEFKPLSWNVCDKFSTASLLQRFVADADTAERKLVAVSNFSCFLTKERKQSAAQPQLDEVFRYCSGAESVAIWIEPRTNAAVSNLFRWVASWVPQRLKKLGARLWGRSESDSSPATTEAQYVRPLDRATSATARLAVLRCDLHEGQHGS